MAEAIQATTETRFVAATRPTLYFIGMTTGKSSIMKVFPRWAAYLKLGEVAIQGIDCKWHDDPAVYRHIVDFIKRDPLSLGALITTHKLDLLKACKDRFGFLDAYADLTGEISCISKRDGDLRGHAKDLITAGLGLEAFLPKDHWLTTGAEVFAIGAGGSSIAITCYLMDPKHGANRPTKILVSNRTAARLDEIKKIHAQLKSPIPIDYYLAPSAESNDALMHKLKPGSLVINATGLGKDAPGSPLSGAGCFPERGLAWDFNYRGELLFLDQARSQAAARQLHVEDGWVYFIHGWTRVIAEVFNIEIPQSGPRFADLSRLAKEAR